MTACGLGSEPLVIVRFTDRPQLLSRTSRIPKRVHLTLMDEKINNFSTHVLAIDFSNGLDSVIYCVTCGARGRVELNENSCDETIIKKLLE